MTRHRLMVTMIVAGAVLLAAAASLSWLLVAGSGGGKGPGNPSHRPRRQKPPHTTGTTAPQPSSTEASPSPSDWTVYHGDPSGSGASASTATFAHPSLAWTSAVLDGQVYGEPLEATGLVFVATENDTVYALSAHDGSVVWSSHLATPVPSTDLPCGDIEPTVGITGTPVVDTARGEIFVVADELVDGAPSHRLVGLRTSSGKVLLDQPVDPPGVDTAALLQRTGLNLDDGRVVWGFGGNDGDCGPYHGWVESVPEGGGAVLRFEADPAPGDRQGALWMGGAAPEVTTEGDVWLAEGNGSVTQSQGRYDGSDSVLELSAGLELLQYFAPSDWYADNAGDRDLGSTAPALLADGMVVQVGKSQTAYLLRQSALGGIGGQVASASACAGADADGGDAVTGTVVYVPCQSGLEALGTSGSPPTLTTLWQSAVATDPPILAGGLVWAIGHGSLYGLDPATGRTEVQLHIGSEANHFPTPAVGDGLLLVAGGDDGRQVLAFSGSQGVPAAAAPSAGAG
jgi:outer membrane protein assembly factor BamB